MNLASRHRFFAALRMTEAGAPIARCQVQSVLGRRIITVTTKLFSILVVLWDTTSHSPPSYVGSDADRRSPNSAKGWTMAPLMDSAGESAVIFSPSLIVVAVKP